MGASLTFDMQQDLEHSRSWDVVLFAAAARSPRGSGRGMDGPRRRGPDTVGPESTMPRYHFDLVNTKTITDQGGAELIDDIEAMDSADALARRILDERPELKSRHYSILVTNQDGDEICRLPFEIIH